MNKVTNGIVVDRDQSINQLSRLLNMAGLQGFCRGSWQQDYAKYIFRLVESGSNLELLLRNISVPQMIQLLTDAEIEHKSFEKSFAELFLEKTAKPETSWQEFYAFSIVNKLASQTDFDEQDNTQATSEAKSQPEAEYDSETGCFDLSEIDLFESETEADEAKSNVVPFLLEYSNQEEAEDVFPAEVTQQQVEECERCLDSQMLDEFNRLNKEFFTVSNGIINRVGNRVNPSTLELMNENLRLMALANQGLEYDLGFKVNPISCSLIFNREWARFKSGPLP